MDSYYDIFLDAVIETIMDSPFEDSDYNDENDAGCDEDDTLISEDNDYNDDIDHEWPWWEWFWAWWPSE